MKLIVHELEDVGLTQELTADRNMIVEAVRPHLYRHNFADGTLKLQILDQTDTVIGESDPVNISDIGSQAFFHGPVRFDINAGLKKNQTYKFKLVGEGGYSFSESAYIGWCNGFDLGKYAPTYTPEAMINYPLDLEVWERKPR